MDWLRITSLCERLHVLPSCGGLLDQNPRHLDKMQGILNIIDEKNQKEAENKQNG